MCNSRSCSAIDAMLGYWVDHAHFYHIRRPACPVSKKSTCWNRATFVSWERWLQTAVCKILLNGVQLGFLQGVCVDVRTTLACRALMILLQNPEQSHWLPSSWPGHDRRGIAVVPTTLVWQQVVGLAHHPESETKAVFASTLCSGPTVIKQEGKQSARRSKISTSPRDVPPKSPICSSFHTRIGL